LDKDYYEPNDKEILGKSISEERNMFVAERFLSHIVEKYGKHPISTDGGTWYPQACKFWKINHHIHFSYEEYYRNDDVVYQI
jgi:putative transposase